MASIIQDMKDIAAENGADWDTVRMLYAELKTAQDGRKAYEKTIRSLVWAAYYPDQPQWWACGLRQLYHRAFRDGDMTHLPGFDMVAESVLLEHPEIRLAGKTDSESLYIFLAAPSGEWTRSTKDLYLEAIDRAGEFCRMPGEDKAEARHAAGFELELAGVPF